MTATGLDAAAIRDAFIGACQDELKALKPGNVHVHAPGHGMEVRHFEVSARAAAPHIAARGLKVGLRIRRAVEASFDAAGCNTNLGIILLCAPIAAAAEAEGGTLQSRIKMILANLDREDAQNAFSAIARANPAGLGRVKKGDVGRPADLTLLEAMRLAVDRDRIARAYVEGFDDIFDFGLPQLLEAQALAASPEEAVTALHMAYLARFPDSHIARKYGEATALRVRKLAQDHIDASRPPFGRAARALLLALDQDLKSQGLNPGTTADFVVATLFAARINSSGSALLKR
jgi:triphosphoribosyl-dephospho-CoA synthase